MVTDRWPLPENLGIYLDRDDGLLITNVEPGSPAQQAGIKAGDQLEMANGTRLFSQADFRGVLHRAQPSASKIEIKLHNRDVEGATSDNWKAGENWWRKSVYDGVYGPYLGLFPLHGRGKGKGNLSIKPYMGKKIADNSWNQYGLLPNQEIVSINGKRDDWNNRQLLTWFRFNHKVGDKVELIVREKGKERTITVNSRPPDGIKRRNPT